MIFVTVGNANQSFDRLLRAIDALAETSIFSGQDVVMQIGHSTFMPAHSRAEKFFSITEFDALAHEASLVICHGGCTVLQLVRWGKFPVVMPRQKKWGEHVNDHQVSFVQALAAGGHLVPAYETQELPKAIARATGAKGVPLPPSRMRELVADAIKNFDKSLSPK